MSADVQAVKSRIWNGWSNNYVRKEEGYIIHMFEEKKGQGQARSLCGVLIQDSGLMNLNEMDNEWPEVIIDDDDAIFDEEIVLSSAELEEAQREAYSALRTAANSAARSIASLATAFKAFGDTLRVIHDEVILSASELDTDS